APRTRRDSRRPRRLCRTRVSQREGDLRLARLARRALQHRAHPHLLVARIAADRLAAMILVGMLDSPYVRRCAISMKLMGVPFDHRSLSVFRTFEQFRAINPVVKAPTLVCSDGAVLMDSTLILDYVESQVTES